MDTESKATEGEDLPAGGINYRLCHTLLFADAANKLDDDLLEMCNNFIPVPSQLPSLLVVALCHDVPFLVSLGGFEHVLAIQRRYKLVVELGLLRLWGRLGYRACDSPLFLPLAVHPCGGKEDYQLARDFRE